MLSAKTKRNIARILPFGLIWLVTGSVFMFVEYAALGGGNDQQPTAIQLDYKVVIFACLAVTGVGLLVGSIELMYLKDKFAKESFTRKILYKLLIYALFFFVIIFLTFPIAASIELKTTVFDRQVWQKYFDYLTSLTNVSTNVQLTASLLLSLFYAEISDNIGHGVLLNFFTGKYHKPIEEQRIFMFLDMKSSTTIAEKLGHIEYFKLLKEYYADLSDAIIEHAGEVYQYVGDEIVVSWTYKAGSENLNCIRCFFAMKEDLQKRAARYHKRFGLLPTFKAGIHLGEVTTGEIGVIKQEIIFTGDVLNATARIQGLCNTYGVDLLLSGDLVNDLQVAATFPVKSLGKTALRGRQEEVELYTIE